MVLNGTAQWASAHFWIVAQVNQFFLDLLCNIQMNVVGCQTLIDIVQHKVDDLQQVILAERLEFDNAVKAIHKLRTEEVTQFTQNGVGAAFTRCSKANAGFSFASSGIGCHDDNGVFEADSPALTIGQAAII